MTEENKVTPNVSKKLMVFGTEEFKTKVDEAFNNGGTLERFYNKKENKMQFKNNNQSFGSVYLVDFSTDFYFFCFENPQHDPKNPWEFVSIDKQKLQYFPSQTDSCIQNFKSFVQFMEEVESFIKKELKEKLGLETEVVIPKAFYGVLEFEFFKNMVQFVEKIEFGIIDFKSYEDKKQLIVSMKVFDLENPADGLIFTDFISE